METSKPIFITGTTGLVGSLLSITALRAGNPVRLLVRKARNQSPEERVRSVLGVFGFSGDLWHHHRPHVELYEGDVGKPQFGLSVEEWERLTDGLSSIYHAAAYCGFANHQAPQARAVNIGGTRNILKLAERSRAHLFHMSSAYIVGETGTRVLEEEQEKPERWKNPYEETKWIAEHHVHSHCREKGLTYTVFRPAVLIGDSSHGRTLRFNSIYHYMKLFHQLSARGKTSPAILEATPEARLNILPVDFAIRAIWNISQLPGCEGKVFHITNPSPPKFAELASIAERLFGLRIECIEQVASRKTIPFEQKRRRGSQFSHYGSYMRGEPEFDMTNTRSLLSDYDSTFPRLDEGYFRKILDYAVAQNWGNHQLTTACQEEEATPRPFTQRYFGEFLAGKVYQPLVENLKGLTAIISITIQGDNEEHWILEVRQGMLTSISHEARPSECTYLMDSTTFEDIARGRCRPEEAFFDGRVNIEGNIEKGLQVATALTQFLASYPFDPKDDPR